MTLQAKAATIAGLVPSGSLIALADARQWTSLNALLGSANRTAPALPVVTARMTVVAVGVTAPLYFALQRMPDPKAPAVAEELTDYRDVTADRPGVDR